MQITEQISDSLDPRVRRTRQMLHDALEHLLGTKAFEKISVGDIAAQATLNRATFYDHYADKSALLEGMVSQRFQELLRQRGVFFDGSCPSALMGITLAMCDYLAGLPGMDCPDRLQLEKNFESALMAVVRAMILSGLARHPPPQGVCPKLLAATISGAVYGGANEWLRTPGRPSAEEATRAILQVISPMLTRD